MNPSAFIGGRSERDEIGQFVVRECGADSGQGVQIPSDLCRKQIEIMESVSMFGDDAD